MRVNRQEPLDPRSTQRKRARRILFDSGRPFICDLDNGRGCGRSPMELPKDAPVGLDLASPENQIESLSLQANHINKDIFDNDLSNLEWLCPGCHKRADVQTKPGVSTSAWDEKGFGAGFDV